MLDCIVDHYIKTLIYSSSMMQLNSLSLLECFQPFHVSINFTFYAFCEFQDFSIKPCNTRGHPVSTRWPPVPYSAVDVRKHLFAARVFKCWKNFIHTTSLVAVLLISSKSSLDKINLKEYLLMQMVKTIFLGIHFALLSAGFSMLDNFYLVF